MFINIINGHKNAPREKGILVMVDNPVSRQVDFHCWLATNVSATTIISAERWCKTFSQTQLVQILTEAYGSRTSPQPGLLQPLQYACTHHLTLSLSFAPVFHNPTLFFLLLPPSHMIPSGGLWWPGATSDEIMLINRHLWWLIGLWLQSNKGVKNVHKLVSRDRERW